MRVFITGGTGFIGSHLVDRLLAEGHRVTCLVRVESDTSYLETLPVERRLIVPPRLGSFDVIYHLAGPLGKRGITEAEFRTPAIELTGQLLQGMNSNQKLVFMSTHWVTQAVSPYELVKIEAEKMIKESGVKSCIVRPSFVYGARDKHHLALFRGVKRLGRLFPIVGDGQNVVCPTYIGDVIDVLMEAAGSSGIVPISGQKCIMNEFVALIAKVLGVGKPRFHLPSVRLEPLASLMRTQFFTTEQKFDTVRRGIDLEEGLRRTVGWYREHGWL